jgi:hypothetical protein
LDIGTGVREGEGRGDGGAVQQPGQGQNNTEGTKYPTWVHRSMVAYVAPCAQQTPLAVNIFSVF